MRSKHLRGKGSQELRVWATEARLSFSHKVAKKENRKAQSENNIGRRRNADCVNRALSKDRANANDDQINDGHYHGNLNQHDRQAD
jgi:hypothetical protein